MMHHLMKQGMIPQIKHTNSFFCYHPSSLLQTRIFLWLAWAQIKAHQELWGCLVDIMVQEASARQFDPTTDVEN